MAWTAPITVTTGDLATAAHWNTYVRDNTLHLAGARSAVVEDTANGFTNTAYADLDALTTDPLSAALTVTVNTMTTAIVMLGANIFQKNTAGNTFMSYRISGATTRASSDLYSIRVGSAVAGILSVSYPFIATGLTAGTNVFEAQARVDSNSGRLDYPSLTVIPLPT